MMKKTYAKPDILHVNVDFGALMVAVSAGGNSVETDTDGEGDGSDAAAKDFVWGDLWTEEPVQDEDEW